MKVLSIDPGFERLGVAILEKNNGKESLVFSTCLRTKKTDSFPDRLFELGLSLEQTVREHSPTHMAIESLFLSTNQKTAMHVAEVRGMILYIARKYELEIFEYTPLQIKTALTGHGKADKTQVAFMVERILSLPDKKRLDDELDAIACGLTHFAYYRKY
jgi:crossover junction endodeoxyribonuclease RuvC